MSGSSVFRRKVRLIVTKPESTITEELGSILNFIKHDGRSQLFKEGTRVATNPSLNIGIFEEHVLGFGEQLAEKGGLSGAARSGYHHSWKVS